MGTMHIVDGKGDTVVKWATEEEAAVKEAEQIFKEKVKQGFAAFEVGSTTDQRVHKFDKNAVEIILIPPMMGG